VFLLRKKNKKRSFPFFVDDKKRVMNGTIMGYSQSSSSVAGGPIVGLFLVIIAKRSGKKKKRKRKENSQNSQGSERDRKPGCRH